jgi:PIN domain nuclease of toxin-antitoxin system
MILLDTHILIWWVNNDIRLKQDYRQILEIEKEPAISIITCWEIAKLVENKRLQLNIPLSDWLEKALDFHNIIALPLDLNIIVDSTTLPGNFHKDPADQMIVSTSRIIDIELMTEDEKILSYPHVKLIRL